MADDKGKRKAVKKFEKAVRKALKRGVTKGTIAHIVAGVAEKKTVGKVAPAEPAKSAAA